MTMIRPPLLSDATLEDDLLAGLGNPWRRELLKFCLAPRTYREVQRQYLLTHPKQLYLSLQLLTAVGWLRCVGESYLLDARQVRQLTALIERLFGRPPDIAEPEDATIDASVAALRRDSCRRVLRFTTQDESSTLELVGLTGLTRKQVYRACRLWARVGVLKETPDTTFKTGNQYRRTGLVVPALGGFLHSLAQLVDNERVTQR